MGWMESPLVLAEIHCWGGGKWWTWLRWWVPLASHLLLTLKLWETLTHLFCLLLSLLNTAGASTHTEQVLNSQPG